MATERFKNDKRLQVLALFALYYVLLNQLQSANAEIQHGGTCNSTDSGNVCKPPLVCKLEFNVCLCPVTQYYDSRTQKCESENNLKRKNIKCRGETDSVICSLSQDDSILNTYVSVNSSSQVIPFSQGQAEIKHLSPGTYYVATITSKFVIEFYNKIITSTVAVWTKPDKPGNISSVRKTKVQETSLESYWYDITFEASRGNVSYYIFMIKNTKEYTNSFETKKTTISNVLLKPGTTYFFSITAYNGNNTSSDVTEGSFKTNAE
ncbi:unnamed protein product, partial [Candidula unifasciata]